MTVPRDLEAQIEAEARNWLIRLRREGPACRDEFEDWYVASPSHADHYDWLLATWETSGLVADSLRRRRRGRHAWLPAVAAMLVVLACLGVVTFAGVGRSRAQTLSLATNVGEIRTDRLSDGTRVTLDTDSQIEAVFTASRREIRLVRGRARIAATPDRDRPMELETGSVTVASGRIVDLMRAGGRSTVAMLGGSGTVHAGPNNITLAAGQAVAIADAGRVMVTGPIALPRGATGWASGMLSFDNAPLGDVVAAANRYTDVHIILSGDATAGLRFTGTFRAGDTMALARMLSRAFHLELSRRSDRAVTLSPAPTK